MENAKKTRLQTRFFFAFLSMSGLIILVFSIFFYQYVSKILIARETTALSDLNSSFLTQCDSAVGDMDAVSIDFHYSAGISNLLGTKELNLTTISLKDFTELCVTINGVQRKVDQINLFDYLGNVLQTGAQTLHSTYDAKDAAWMAQTLKTGGSKILSTPYQTKTLWRYLSTSSADWCISLYRGYFNSFGRQVGATEVVKRCKSIFRPILSYNAANEDAPAVYVYNADGALLYPYEDDAEAPSFDYFSLASAEPRQQSFLNPATNQEQILAFETSRYTDWTYVCVQEKSTVLAPVDALTRLLAGVSLAMIAASAGIAYYMSRTLMRPINELRRAIKHTDLAALELPPDTLVENHYAELEHLNQTFHKMRRNLKTSMDELLLTRQQELKSRTLALQSQINPHFYYNSLAAVIVLAENGQDDEVIRVCRSLTRMMRYVTDTALVVTVADEAAYLEQYFHCMKVRYQSSLSYHIAIDPALLPLRIPRLIIQPLVENALKYSTQTAPPWHFSIRGTQDKTGWRIEVEDCGNGFTDEGAQTIRDRMREADENPGMPDLQINGMGMLNVYLRWRLHCGESTVFTFGNTPEGHGIVAIGRTKTPDAAEGIAGASL